MSDVIKPLKPKIKPLPEQKNPNAERAVELRGVIPETEEERITRRSNEARNRLDRQFIEHQTEEVKKKPFNPYEKAS